MLEAYDHCKAVSKYSDKFKAVATGCAKTAP